VLSREGVVKMSQIEFLVRRGMMMANAEWVAAGNVKLEDLSSELRIMNCVEAPVCKGGVQ